MANTYFEFVVRIAATKVARAHYGSRLFGSAIGLMANLMMEGCAQAVRNVWFRRDSAPDDAVLLKGAESRLPIYAGESAAAYKARVGNRWTLLETAPTEDGIDAQLAAAGLNGTVLLQPTHPGPGLEASYWSQFWIQTSHSDDASLAAIAAIVRRHKPAEELYRGPVLTGFTSQLVAIGDTYAVGEEAIG